MAQRRFFVAAGAEAALNAFAQAKLMAEYMNAAYAPTLYWSVVLICFAAFVFTASFSVQKAKGFLRDLGFGILWSVCFAAPTAAYFILREMLQQSCTAEISSLLRKLFADMRGDLSTLAAVVLFSAGLACIASELLPKRKSNWLAASGIGLCAAALGFYVLGQLATVFLDDASTFICKEWR